MKLSLLKYWPIEQEVLMWTCWMGNFDTELLKGKCWMLTSGETFSGLASQEHLRRPRKSFKHFVDEKIFEEIVTIARMLGFYGLCCIGS